MPEINIKLECAIDTIRKLKANGDLDASNTQEDAWKDFNEALEVLRANKQGR